MDNVGSTPTGQDDAFLPGLGFLGNFQDLAAVSSCPTPVVRPAASTLTRAPAYGSALSNMAGRAALLSTAPMRPPARFARGPTALCTTRTTGATAASIQLEVAGSDRSGFHPYFGTESQLQHQGHRVVASPQLYSEGEEVAEGAASVGDKNTTINLDGASNVDGTDNPAAEAPSGPADKGKSKRGRPRKGAGEKKDEPGEKKKPAKRRKKKELTEEDEEALEEGKRMAWKLDWVIKLIEERIRLDAEFSKVKKQGVDIWAQIALNIVAAFPDFDKDAEACRQKFKRILKDYQKDKAQNAKSGSNPGDSCPWFEQMDEFFGCKATLECVAHVSAQGAGGLAENEEELPFDRKNAVSRKQSAVQEVKAIMSDAQSEILSRFEAIEERKNQTIKEGFAEIKDLLKMLMKSDER